MDKQAARARREATMIKKHGSLENWKQHMREIGRQGGSTPTERPKGFAKMKADGNHERLREIASKGRRTVKEVESGQST